MTGCDCKPEACSIAAELLLSADSGPYYPRPGTGKFDPYPSFAIPDPSACDPSRGSAVDYVLGLLDGLTEGEAAERRQIASAGRLTLMRRRDLIILLGGAAAWPLTVRA